MVEEGLKLEPEVISIFQHIDNGDNFLLSGGAGSGKTYSLVQVISEALRRNPTAKVACMTFTNAAVREIEDRVNHPNLRVTTIHDFLWDCIKSFQHELKKTIISLINDDEETNFVISDGRANNDYYDGLDNVIQYKEWLSLKDGIISHDELLIIAEKLFEAYPKLSDIVKDKFEFIFIDEYQDTNSAVVKLFLKHLRSSRKRNIIGFFGDAMQSIYDDGIGNLNEYKGIAPGDVKEVKKEQNRRSPQSVINLANRLRNDGIVQVPSMDSNAPNMINGAIKEGKILFLHSVNSSLDTVREFLTREHYWVFTDAKQTKELNLTHNLIAEKAGFKTLMEIYDKDSILAFKDRIRSFIKDEGVLTDFCEMTFGQVINYLQNGKVGRELDKVSPTRSMQAFINDHPDLFTYALSQTYSEISRLYVRKEQLVDDKKQNEDDDKKKGSKRDNLIRHLFKIQTNIALYKNKQYNEFLRVTDYKKHLISVADKRRLKENIENLINVGDKTIEKVIEEADQMGLCLIDDKLRQFIERNKYLYNRIKEVKFEEFQCLFNYLEGKTPFSTQHKTKGAEFNNVLVVLDNGGWNSYNFKNLFLNSGTPSVLERTQKIFYVCCTRAKENLAVFYHDPDEQVIAQAKLWFGDANVVNI